MQQAVGDRSEHDAGDGDKDQTRKKGVGAGKQLAGGGVEVVDGSHAAKEHGCIEQGINPGHVFAHMIAHHADAEGHDGQHHGDDYMPRHAHEKAFLGNKRGAVMFVHGAIIPQSE
jgi:hypothetical protein